MLSAGLVAAAWAVGIGLLVCAALTVLGWTVGGHGSATFDVALRAGGLVFVRASHLTPVSLPAGTVSLLPLGLLALPLLLTYRAGRWAVRSSDCRSLSSAAGLSAIAAGGYAAAVAVVAGVSDIDGVHAACRWRCPSHSWCRSSGSGRVRCAAPGCTGSCWPRCRARCVPAP